LDPIFNFANENSDDDGDDGDDGDDDDGDVKAEAERLRQQREMQHEEEFSQLKLAEEELVQVCISSLLLSCENLTPDLTYALSLTVYHRPQTTCLYLVLPPSSVFVFVWR